MGEMFVNIVNIVSCCFVLCGARLVKHIVPARSFHRPPVRRPRAPSVPVTSAKPHTSAQAAIYAVAAIKSSAPVCLRVISTLQEPRVRSVLPS